MGIAWSCTGRSWSIRNRRAAPEPARSVEGSGFLAGLVHLGARLGFLRGDFVLLEEDALAARGALHDPRALVEHRVIAARVRAALLRRLCRLRGVCALLGLVARFLAALLQLLVLVERGLRRRSRRGSWRGVEAQPLAVAGHGRL